MNLFSKAKIDYNNLIEYNPTIAMSVSRMLQNNVSPKRVRNYIRANVEESAARKIIKKKPKMQASKTSSAPTKVKLKNANLREFKLPEDNAIAKEFEVLIGSHAPIYNPIVYTYVFINHMLLSSQEAKNMNGVINQSFNSQRSIMEQTANALARQMDNYLRPGDKFVETRLKMQKSQLTMRIGASAQEDAMVYAKLLKTIFPSFELPKTFSRSISEDLTEETRKNLGIPEYELGELTTFKGMTTQVAEYSLGELMAKNYNYRHVDDANEGVWKGSDQLVFPADMIPSKRLRKSIKDLVHFRFVLSPDVSSTNARMANVVREMEKGNVSELNSPATLVYDLAIEAYVRWPKELAMYVTCSREENTFVPAMFYRLVKWTLLTYSAGGLKRGRGAAGTRVPERISHLDMIKRRIDVEKQKRRIKPRVNEDNFAILGSAASASGLTGAVVYIPPDVDKVDEYMSYYKTAYNPNTNEVIFDSKKALINQPIFTDWYNEKLIIAGAEENSTKSNTQTINLLGCKPLDSITIGRDLNSNFQTSSPLDYKRFVDSLKKGFSESLTAETAAMTSSQSAVRNNQILFTGLTDDELAQLQSRRLNDINTIINYVAETGEDFLTWGHLGYVRDENTAQYPTLSICLKVVRNVCDYMLSTLDTTNIAYSTRISGLLYRLYLVSKYSKEYAKHNSVYADAVTRNSYVENDPAKMNFKLYNLPGITQLLPHQSKNLSSLSTDPEKAILHVRAGGGKSLISIAKLMEMVGKGLIKRPLICMPGRLVRQFAKEILDFSEGQVNAFPLTLETVRNMQQLYQDPKDKSVNYAPLAQIMNACPPNTIFLCSLTFLSNNSEDIIYGNEVVTRYYTAEFMRDFGFDALVVDESQFIKNSKSSRTNAVSVLASNIKYIVPMSGTVVHNTLVDLVGQMSIINAAAVGSETHFKQKYMDGKVVKEGATRQVRADMKAFVKMLYAARREWAFALPKIDEAFHAVDMTSAQRDFYSKLMNDALEEIKKDEKLVKKMQTAGEEEQRAIEAKLRTYFANVEEFVYAPDANPGFVSQTRVTKTDLVSAKVHKMDELIDNHIKSGDKHKIIVFSYRKATSLHIMRHTKHKSIAVHYSAGNLAALQAFETDDNIKVLIADEASISFGNNFQYASRLIRMESLWTPGDMDQAVARIWRLAFKAGKDRKIINLDHVFTDNSLEVAKIARLISKTITTRQFEEGENPEFTSRAINLDEEGLELVQSYGVYVNNSRPVADSLETLQPIVMNLETLQIYNNRDTLAAYFGNYALLNMWEDQEFERYSKDPTMKLWDVPDNIRAKIPGSKQLAYMPRAPGQNPYDPGGKLGLVAISRFEQDNAMEGEDVGDDNDSDEESEDTISVQPGEFVNTEFGYGYITRVKDKTIDVAIKGLKDEVTVLKSTAYLVQNPTERIRIKKEIRGLPQGNPWIPLGVDLKLGNFKNFPDDEISAKKSSAKLEDKDVKVTVLRTAKTNIKKNMVLEDGDEGEEEIDTKAKFNKKEIVRGLGNSEVDITDDDEMFDLSVDLIDYKIAMTVYEADSDTQYLSDRLGFKAFPAFLAIQIKNVRQLERVMDTLKSKFTIDKAYVEAINTYAKRLPGGPEKMKVFDPSQYEISKRFIRVSTFKKVSKGVLRPYPLVWDGQLFLVITRATHPSVTRVPAALSKIPGLQIQEVEDLRMRFFENARSAEAFLEQIKEKVSRKTYRECVSALQGFRKIHRAKVTMPGEMKTRIGDKKPAKPAPKVAPKKPASKTGKNKKSFISALKKISKLR